MFDLSFEKVIVLILAALFILGPERLPEAAAWVGKMIRQLRTFSETAQRKIEEEAGPEIRELAKPFSELREPIQSLRKISHPRKAATDYFVSGNPSRAQRPPEESDPDGSPTFGGERPEPTSGRA